MSLIDLNDPVSRGTAVAVHYANTLTRPGATATDPLDAFQVACIVADLLDAVRAAGGDPGTVIDEATDMAGGGA